MSDLAYWIWFSGLRRLRFRTRRALLERYRAEAAKFPRLTIGGRLGGYKYLDMDHSIGAALAVDIG